MRNSIVTLAGVVLFFGSFSLSVLLKKHMQLEQASRAPASLTTANPQAIGATIAVPEGAITTAYHFERSVHADIQEKVLKPIIDLEIRGTVFLTELSHSVNSRLISLQFELTQGAEKEVHESHLPFVLELSDDQNIKSIRIPKTLAKVDEDDANVLKDFASLYAYGVNRDTTGTYQFKLDHHGTLVKKTKLKYEGVTSQTLAILNSDAHGEVDAAGAWTKAQGKEKTRMDGMGQALLTTSFFKIEKMSAAVKPKNAVQAFAGLQETSLELVSHSEIAVKPWTLLKAQLVQIRTLTRVQRLALFHDLSKLLKSDPEALREFRLYIEASAKEPGLLTFGIGVLATAGTDAAQAILRDWYNSGYGVEHTVLNAFSTANAQLNSDTRGFLKDILAKQDSSPELAQNAAYAMGASLKHANDDSTRSALNAYYASSKNETDKLTALDAIGNSGDQSFLPTLKIAAQSPNAAEREKAVFGARFLPSDSAAPLLFAGYQDGALAVKNASIRALAFQENLVPHAPLIRQCASAGNNACQMMLSQLSQ